MPSTALYARVSTTSEEQQQALEQQLTRLRNAAPNAQEFVDIESGTKTSRPAWDQLMDLCRAGQVSRVIATRLDRISRNRIHGAQLLQYFMQESAPTLQLLDDAIDLSTSGGRFMASLLISWSVAESERLGERTKHGHAHRRSQGKPFGPQAPFGYRWNADRSNYEPDPTTAPIAKDLIRGFINEERGLRASVKYAMDHHGIKLSGQSGFKRWLLNPSLAGMRVYGVSTVTVDDNGNKVRRHNRPGIYGEVHADMHPALITEAEHARLISMFEAPRDQSKMPVKDGRVRVATGLGICGHCFRKLHIHHSGTKRWYRCANDTCEQRFRNRAPEMDIIIAACQRMHEDEAERLAQQLIQVDIEDNNPETDEVKQLRQSINKLRAENDPDLTEVITKKERRLLLLTEQAVQRSRIKPEDAQAFFGDMDNWQRMYEKTPSALRDLLLAAVVGVVVKDSEIQGVALRRDMQEFAQHSEVTVPV